MLGTNNDGGQSNAEFDAILDHPHFPDAFKLSQTPGIDISRRKPKLEVVKQCSRISPPAVLLGPPKMLTGHIEMIERKSREALTEAPDNSQGVWGLRFYRMGIFTM